MNLLLVKQLALSLTIVSGILCVLKVVRKCSIVICDVAVDDMCTYNQLVSVEI